MFPWENPERLEIFSTWPNSVHDKTEQREFDRRFRKLTRHHRRKERAIGPRMEQWKWQRFLDGDFSSFKDEFDAVVLIPVWAILACIVVLGMFIVQLDYVDEDRYRQFMATALLALGLGVLLLRCLAFYAVRVWVFMYGQACIHDRWILNDSGHIEEVAAIDEPQCDE